MATSTRADIKFELTGSDKASRVFDSFSKKSQGSLGKIARGAKKLAGGMAIAGAAGATAFGGLIKFGIDQTKAIQGQVAGIQALTKNADEAGKVISDMVEFVQGKPFDRLDAIGAAKQMLAFGRSVTDVNSDMDLLGRAAILGNASLEEMAGIIGEVSARNKVFAEDINQLVERGINIFPELSKITGRTMEDLQNDLQSVDFDTFREALDRTLDPKIVEAAGATIEQRMTTLSASFRNLAFEVLGVDFAKIDENGRPLIEEGGLFDLLLDGLEKVIEILKSPVTVEFFKGIGETLVKAVKGLVNFGKKVAEFVDSIIDFFVNVEERAPIVAKAIQFLKDTWQLLADFFTVVVIPVFQEFWEKHGEEIIKALKVIAAILGGVLLAAFAGIVAIIFIVVGAITAFIAIMNFIRQKSLEQIEAIKQGWQTLKDQVTLVISLIKAAWVAFRDFIASVWNGIKNTAISIWNSIVNAIGNIINKIKTIVGGVKDSVVGVWNSIKDSAISAFNRVKSVIDGVISKVKALKDKIIDVANKIPFLSFQTGGVVPGRVGEAVPIIAHGGEVITNPALGQGAQTNNFDFNVNLNSEAATQLFFQKMQERERAVTFGFDSA